MGKYVLIYSGGSGMPETQEEQEQLMAAWGAWFESMGDAVVDGGNPFGAAQSIAPDGSASDGSALGATGFSVIQADGLDKATAHAQGCPVLTSGGTVDVMEAIDM